MRFSGLVPCSVSVPSPLLFHLIKYLILYTSEFNKQAPMMTAHPICCISNRRKSIVSCIEYIQSALQKISVSIVIHGISLFSRYPVRAAMSSLLLCTKGPAPVDISSIGICEDMHRPMVIVLLSLVWDTDIKRDHERPPLPVTHKNTCITCNAHSCPKIRQMPHLHCNKENTTKMLL